MRTKIIVGLLLAVFALTPFYLGGIYLDALLCLVILLLGDELSRLVKTDNHLLISILVDAALYGLFFCSPSNIVYYLAFVATIGFIFPLVSKEFSLQDILLLIVLIFLFTMAIVGLRSMREFSLGLSLIVVIANYATDTFAYFVGVNFGKTKLIPHISPNKTVEGAIGGMIGSLLVIVIGKYFFLPNLSWVLTIILSITLPIASQIGDLAFSFIKRSYKIKDFSSLFPGHGGVIDRIDSLIFVIVYISFIMHVIS